MSHTRIEMQAMDAQVRQAESMSRIAMALEQISTTLLDLNATLWHLDRSVSAIRDKQRSS